MDASQDISACKTGPDQVKQRDPTGAEKISTMNRSASFITFCGIPKTQDREEARTIKSTDESGEYLGGRNAVKEALRGDASRCIKVMLSKTAIASFQREIRGLAKENDVPVQMVPPQRLNKQLPNVNHQGVILVVSPVGYLSVHELLSGIAPQLDDVRASNPIVLLLDHIQDPYNFGAILRSAVATGVAGVIIPEREAAPVNATVLKASAGAATKIPIARTSNISRVMEEMKERGYWIVGAAGDGETSIWDMDWDRPLGIVIGSEGKGMRRGVSKMCDFTVSIPISGNVDSLNASVAAGIILVTASRTK